ncbi:COG4315 family predicted lipoprotein [Rugosimonospora acidiphila]
MLVNRALIPVAVVAALFLSGCVESTVPVETPTPAPSYVRVSGLFAVATKIEGDVVIDGRGYVLYRSALDRSSPTRSVCTGSCTDLWLPVPSAPNLRLEGINRELVGTYRRPDGRTQLTLGGWPLYEYAGDRTPGDTGGRGIAGSWWLVRPDGSLDDGH